MCVYLCVSIWGIYTTVSTCFHMILLILVYICRFIYMCVCLYLSTYLCVCMGEHMLVYMYVRIYVPINVGLYHMYMSTCVSICV